ncbi:MAG: enolase C-terminal domain-like protein, partial [Acidimicrobiia bacterium]
VDVYVDLHGGDQLMSLDNVLRYRTPFWSSLSGITETRGSFWEEGDPDADSLEAMIDRATTAVALGFSRLKFDLDAFGRSRDRGDRSLTQQELAAIRERAQGVRNAVGQDIGIAFDCHWRFDIPTALAVAEAVAPSQPMWLEDPVPPHPSTLRAVTERSPVPIATGENVYLLDGFMPFVEENSLHIVTPDVQKTGGLLETLRIADFAGRRFMPIAPHCIASPLGFMASAHVMAAAANAMCLEFHGTDVPFWNELVSGPPVIEKGRCAIADAPGIGVDLNLEVVRAYSAPGEPVFDQPPVR